MTDVEIPIVEVHQVRSSALPLAESPDGLNNYIQDYMLKSRGGSDEISVEERERLIKSLLAKAKVRGYKEISPNKILKAVLQKIDPIISDQRFWRIIAELTKPNNFHVIQATSPSTSLNRPKGFENVKDDFESRSAKQEALELRQKKALKRYQSNTRLFSRLNFLLPVVDPPRPPVFQSNLPHKKTASVLKQEKIGSNVNSLDKPVWRAPQFKMRDRIIVYTEPSSAASTNSPTPELFSADAQGYIQNVDVAFNYFKERITQIGNQYTGEKREYFFEQLNKCNMDRFKAMATEKGKMTIYNVREAEILFQAEFERLPEPESVTRPTQSEVKAGNGLDGRLRKGLLSGDPNTLNKQYTDIDAKLFVSDKTLKYQAEERAKLKHRNPEPMSMYEQGKLMGSSIVAQEYKHCNRDKPELPSSHKNVKHVISALELAPGELELAKAGLIDDAKIAWADRLNVPANTITDQQALEGMTIVKIHN